MAKERIAWLDYAKGLGIILVIYGHAICPNSMNVWLCSFHMPLFFILSGFTFPSYNKYSFKEFAVKKFKSVIIPYFVFATCLTLWKLVCIPIQGGGNNRYSQGGCGHSDTDKNDRIWSRSMVFTGVVSG